MKKQLVIISCIFLLITLALSGCYGTQTESKPKKNKDINFSSNVLELYDKDLEVKEENGEIYFVEVILYFKNKLDKNIKVVYAVDFCDINDDVIYSKTYTLKYVPKNYKFITPDIFSYNGDNVKNFDHININIKDYEIMP